MSKEEVGKYKIALLGNPNCGKSTIFNLLTGLNQKISNFPGVTVEKKTGKFKIGEKDILLIDLPGLYSLHPNSKDEKVIVNLLANPDDPLYPDLIIYIADGTNLERHTLLASQVADLGIPMIFVINMVDILNDQNHRIDTQPMKEYLEVPVVPVSSRELIGIDHLKDLIAKELENLDRPVSRSSKYNIPPDVIPTIEKVKQVSCLHNDYLAKLYAHHYKWLNHLSANEVKKIGEIVEEEGFEDLKNQIHETMSRFSTFDPILRKSIIKQKNDEKNLTEKIDDIVTHRILGPLLFFVIMFLMFQAIYSWSAIPMDFIDSLFLKAGLFLRDTFPDGWILDLVVDGILAGLGGIMIFIPQITILFLIITILEETGYMSRAVFMFDGLMQRFGLNGRSIVSLISSSACAIPAVMSTRTISNTKERLITIMVSPLISCSARLPVYAILIGFVVPEKTVFGFFNAQGLAFMGLYLLGIVAALSVAWVFKKLLRGEDDNSFLMMELPQYRRPLWKNALLTVKNKVWTFVTQAGKIILFFSIILWVLANFGPSQAMENAQREALTLKQKNNLPQSEYTDILASKKLEASYAGMIGKTMEPVIKPLGFDWKIGIALLTSFAAREIFVSTISTIYSIGSTDDETTIKERLGRELRPGTNRKMFDFPTSLSLLLFYVFAMQCMSTFAIVRRETNSWKWPFIQLIYMTALAYLASFSAYHIFT